MQTIRQAKSRTRVLYPQFIRFLFPLMLLMIVQGFSRQVLNGGMARMPRATETLASYGLAWGVVTVLTSPLLQGRQLALVLVDSRPAFIRVGLFVLVCGILLGAILVSLATTPPGIWIIEDLHGVSHSLGLVARETLLWLAPFPVVSSMFRFYSGLLIRIKRTDIVSYAALAGIVASIATVFALLPARAIQNKPILLPILVTYASAIPELGIVLWGYQRYVKRTLQDGSQALTWTYMIRFFWPLALIMAIQGLSRPLINLFISRGADGEQALAVLTVVYALGHLPYGWLNDIRSLPPAFREKKGSLAAIRRFALGCGLLSFSTMIFFYWTPLRDTILVKWIGVEAELVKYCKWPLILFTFFPLAVMVRAYLHGVGLLEHRTKALAPSGPARIGAILVSLTLFYLLQSMQVVTIHGATRALAALLSGFVVETLVVWWGVRGRAALYNHRSVKQIEQENAR
jgi:hypothetical protein